MEGDYCYYMVQLYLVITEWIKAIDKKYGKGVSKFIGGALKFYTENSKPRM